MIVTQTLRNNICLITEPIDNVRTASVGFWFSVGSRYENEGEYGITHFTEHLIFKGTKSRTTHDIASFFDCTGGYINAFTERENVCLYCTIPVQKNNFESAVDVLCDIAQNCTFPEEEVERERFVVQTEISAVEDDSEESSFDSLAKNLWKNKSLGKKITGTHKDVKNLDRNKILEWYRKYFVKGELVVVASGNIDVKILKEKLEKLNQHKKVLRYPDETHFKEKVLFSTGAKICHTSFNQSQIFSLFPVIANPTKKQFYTLVVFNSLIGENMTSRLFEVLREKSGLCYSVYSFFTIYENAAFWGAFCGSEKNKCIKAVKLLQEELHKIQDCEFSDEEIERAKEHICGEEIMNEYDTEYIIKRLQRNFSLGFELQNTSQILECIRSINKNDIINLVQNVLDLAKNYLFVYSPKLSEKCENQLLKKISVFG